MKLWLLVTVAALTLAGCASTTTSTRTESSDRTPATRAADHALKMVGKLYRYGGSTPAGFDCSGLVQFSFRQAGIKVPRSTEDQRHGSRRIKASSLQRGDLLFFDQEGKKNSHVGIYLGDGKFVHAPSTGARVRSDRLDSPYWRAHLSETRRI